MTFPLCKVCDKNMAHMHGTGLCHSCWALSSTVKASEDLVRKILATLEKERGNS